MGKLIEETEELLSEIGEIVRDYRDDQQKRDKDGKNFNVFKVLGVHRNKECMHSAFIAKLLDPMGAHGKKDLFLKEFKKQMIDCFYKKGWSFDTQNAKVRIEHPFKNGRIDILIESGSSKDKKGIIIENKIDTCDHDAQLSRYCLFGKDKYGPEKYKLIYLTPEGDEATENNEELDYIIASYKEDLIPWLTQSIKKCASDSVLQTLIQQYQTNLKDILGMMMDKQTTDKLLKKAVLKKNVSATLAIINHKEEIRKQIIHDFIVQIKKLEKLPKFKGVKIEFDEDICELKDDTWIRFSYPKISDRWEFVIGTEKYRKTIGGVRYGIRRINTSPLITKKEQLASLKLAWGCNDRQDCFRERKSWPLGWDYLGDNDNDWKNWIDDWITFEDMAHGNILRWIKQEFLDDGQLKEWIRQVEKATQPQQ